MVDRLYCRTDRIFRMVAVVKQKQIEKIRPSHEWKLTGRYPSRLHVTSSSAEGCDSEIRHSCEAQVVNCLIGLSSESLQCLHSDTISKVLTDIVFLECCNNHTDPVKYNEIGRNPSAANAATGSRIILLLQVTRNCRKLTELVTKLGMRRY